MIVSAENEHYQQQLLPDEICIDILSRLPTDSILQCKRVCKAWHSIIEQDHVFHARYTRRLISSATSSSSSSSSLDFFYLERVKDKFLDITYDKLRFIEYNVAAAETITMYLKRNTVTLPLKQHLKTDDNLRFMIVGSCNGLICLATYSYDDDVHHHIFVSNPLTGENIDLSPTTTELHHYQNSSLCLMRIGFGYLPSTNEYKVVRIFTINRWERRIADVQVYTLGSRTGTDIIWRTIPRTSWCNMVFENRASDRARARGVSVNGVIYFNDYTKIISFDLENEEFRIIVPPQPTCITKFEQLGVLRGCLCGTSRNAIPAEIYSETLDLWVMEEKNDTWIKTYTIQCGKLHSMPLGNALFPPNSTILLMQPEKENKIDSYNAETGFIMSSRNIPGDHGHWYHGNYLGGLEIIPYVNSCVSLKALGEKYAKRSWSSDAESFGRKICKERKLEKRRRSEAGWSAKGAFKKRKGKPKF